MNLSEALLASWNKQPVEQYAKKAKNEKRQTLLFGGESDDLGAGRWITIHSEEGSDGSHHGGQHVFVGADGKMKTGNFAGQTMGEAFGKSEEKPKEPPKSARDFWNSHPITPKNPEPKSLGEPYPDDTPITEPRGNKRFAGAATIGEVKSRLHKGETLVYAKYGGGNQYEIRKAVTSKSVWGSSRRGIVATFELKEPLTEPEAANPEKPGILPATGSAINNEDAKAGDQLGLFGEGQKAPSKKWKPTLPESQGKQAALFDTKGDKEQMLMFDDGVTPDDRLLKPEKKAESSKPPESDVKLPDLGAKSPDSTVKPPEQTTGAEQRTALDHKIRLEKAEVESTGKLPQHLIDKAHGHEDNEATQAARRILQNRYGVDWKDTKRSDTTNAPKEEAKPETGRDERGKEFAPGVTYSTIPRSAGYAAHAGSSFSPDKRAEQESKGFAHEMNDYYEHFVKSANGDPQKLEILAQEWPEFLSRAKARKMALLAANSRTMSTMIAGPSNFPTRSNQKRLDTAHRRLEDLIEGNKKGVAAVLKKMHPEDAPKKIGDAGTGSHIDQKLAQLKKKQETMKAANKIVQKVLDKKASGGRDGSAVFKKGHTLESAIAELSKIEGISEKSARQLLTPDFAGRYGFASYELTNNNANIRRYEQQAAAQTRFEKEAKTAASAGEEATTHEFDGGKVHLDYDDNRIRIAHDTKPDKATIDKLKSHGFRWSPSNKAWQRQLTSAAKNAVVQITGIDRDKLWPKSDDEEKYSIRWRPMLLDHYATEGSAQAGCLGEPEHKKKGLPQIPASGRSQENQESGKPSNSTIDDMWTGVKTGNEFYSNRHHNEKKDSAPKPAADKYRTHRTASESSSVSIGDSAHDSKAEIEFYTAIRAAWTMHAGVPDERYSGEHWKHQVRDRLGQWTKQEIPTVDAIREMRSSMSKHLQVWADATLRGKRFRNTDTGWNILVDRRAIAKMAGRGAPSAWVLPAMQKILEGAVLLGSEKSQGSNPNDISWNYLGHPVIIDSQLFAVKVTVRETVSHGHKAYNVHAVEIEKGPSQRQTNPGANQLSTAVDGPSPISIDAAWEKIKKGNDFYSAILASWSESRVDRYVLSAWNDDLRLDETLEADRYEWVESQHPREAAGTPIGGQFKSHIEVRHPTAGTMQAPRSVAGSGQGFGSPAPTANPSLEGLRRAFAKLNQPLVKAELVNPDKPQAEQPKPTEQVAKPKTSIKRELQPVPKLQPGHALHQSSLPPELRNKVLDWHVRAHEAMRPVGITASVWRHDMKPEEVAQATENEWAKVDKNHIRSLLAEMNQMDRDARAVGINLAHVVNGSGLIPRELAVRLDGGERFFDPAKIAHKLGDHQEPQPEARQQGGDLTPEDKQAIGELKNAPDAKRKELLKSDAMREAVERALGLNPSGYHRKLNAGLPQAPPKEFEKWSGDGLDKHASNKLDRAIADTLGDGDDAKARHLRGLAVDAWKQMKEHAESHNEALRAVTSFFGKHHGALAANIAKGIDPTRLKGFDELAEHAAREYPQLVSQFRSESETGSAEEGLTKALREGIRPVPNPWDDDVIDRAVEMAGPSFFEHQDYDPTAVSVEDEEPIPFSATHDLSWAVYRYWIKPDVSRYVLHAWNRPSNDRERVSV